MNIDLRNKRDQSMKTTCAIGLLATAAWTLPGQEIPKQPAPPIIKDNSKLPHVVLIAMSGSTIGSRGLDRMNLTSYGDGPKVEPEDWLRDLPELQNLARVTTVDMRTPKGRHDPGETFEDMRAI